MDVGEPAEEVQTQDAVGANLGDSLADPDLDGANHLTLDTHFPDKEASRRQRLERASC